MLTESTRHGHALNPADTKACTPNDEHPEKVYYGRIKHGNNINAGARNNSDAPLYLMYVTRWKNDEHNLLGHSPWKIKLTIRSLL